MPTADKFRDTRSYIMGLLTGVSVAVAAAAMMGQGYSKPSQPAAAPKEQTAPPAAAPREPDEYFVTSGNDANTTARLWRRPGGRSALEYVGEYQSTGRANR